MYNSKCSAVSNQHSVARGQWGVQLLTTEENAERLLFLEGVKNEQITYVIEGEIEFTLEGQSMVLKAGDGVVVKSNQEHSATVLGRPRGTSAAINRRLSNYSATAILHHDRLKSHLTQTSNDTISSHSSRE